MGLKVSKVTFSPIRGPEGNIEYLMYFSKNGEDNNIEVEEIVKISHEVAV